LQTKKVGGAPCTYLGAWRRNRRRRRRSNWAAPAKVCRTWGSAPPVSAAAVAAGAAPRSRSCPPHPPCTICRRLLRAPERDGIPRPAASRSQHQPPPPRRTHTSRRVESIKGTRSGRAQERPGGDQRSNAQEGRGRQGRGRRARRQERPGRKTEPEKTGWGGNRERPGAHNRNATQRQEGEGEEEAEQAGDRDEAPLFLLSVSLTPARGGTPECPPGSVGQAVSHSSPAKLPPFLCDCLVAVCLGSPSNFGCCLSSRSMPPSGFVLGAEVRV
jgi:hypothetical protein